MEAKKIKAVLKADKETFSYEGNARIDQKKKLLQYQDDHAILTLYYGESLLLRETQDAILSYKFGEKHSRFSIFVKDLQKTGILSLETKELKKEEKRFMVIYRIEGNDFDHEYVVEWS